MKKYLFIIVLICGFLLSGCIDIYQHITKDNNGNERNTIKITLNKAIFEIGSSFGGIDDFDFEDIFNESDFDIHEYKQFGASVTAINNDFDAGYLIDMRMDYRDRNIINQLNKEKFSFIHKYNGKNISIHIDCLGESGADFDNAMAAAFLASGKYRLFISK